MNTVEQDRSKNSENVHIKIIVKHLITIHKKTHTLLDKEVKISIIIIIWIYQCL